MKIISKMIFIIKKIIIINFPYKKHKIDINDRELIINLSKKNIFIQSRNNIANRIFIGNYEFHNCTNLANITLLQMNKYNTSFNECENLYGCFSCFIKKFIIKYNKIIFWSEKIKFWKRA